MTSNALHQQEAHSNDSSAVPWTPQGQSTAAFLEDLTRALIAEFVSGRDFVNSDLFRKHIHPNVVLTGFRWHLADAAQQYADDHRSEPAFEVHNITANVRRGTREAEVYYTIREHARSSGKGLMREVCAEALWWRRVEDGVWQLYR